MKKSTFYGLLFLFICLAVPLACSAQDTINIRMGEIDLKELSLNDAKEIVKTFPHLELVKVYSYKTGEFLRYGIMLREEECLTTKN